MVAKDSKGRLVARRVLSEDLETQGPGSWVEFRRRLKAKHLRTVARMATFGNMSFNENPQETLDAFEQMGDIMSKFVAGWNWVDEDGEELPQPNGNPDVFDELDFSELMWLIEQMGKHVGGLKEKN